MNKLLLVAAFVLSPMAQADVQPEDVFGAIFDIIQDQIKKDKQDDLNGDHDWKSNKVLLQNQGDKIILGRVFIDNETGVDNVNFPPCNQSPNAPVTHLRFVVKRADVFIEMIRVTFQNGVTHTFDVEEDFQDGDKSPWMDLAGNARCIKKIRVVGETNNVMMPPNWNNNPWNNHWNNHPGWNNGPGNNFEFGFNDEPSVITFVGLKN